MGVIQKGFQHDSHIKKGISMMYHSALYIVKRSSGFQNGEYFLHTLDKSTLTRMVQAPDNIFLKKMMKITLPSVYLDILIEKKVKVMIKKCKSNLKKIENYLIIIIL